MRGEREERERRGKNPSSKKKLRLASGGFELPLVHLCPLVVAPFYVSTQTPREVPKTRERQLSIRGKHREILAIFDNLRFVSLG